jgi:hypothetical protein
LPSLVSLRCVKNLQLNGTRHEELEACAYSTTQFSLQGEDSTVILDFLSAISPHALQALRQLNIQMCSHLPLYRTGPRISYSSRLKAFQDEKRWEYAWQILSTTTHLQNLNVVILIEPMNCLNTSFWSLSKPSTQERFECIYHGSPGTKEL